MRVSNSKCVVLGAVLSAWVATSAVAQEAVTRQPSTVSTSARWPIELSALADSVGFLPGAPHPLLSLGTEIPWDNSGVFRLAQAVQLDYRLQPQFLHGPGVSTRLLLRLMANVGFFGELGLGVGYLMAFWGPDTWRVDPSSGEFARSGDAPRHLFKATVGLAVGLDCSVRWKLPLRVSVAYDETILFNVAPAAGFPILPTPGYGVRLAWFFGGA